MSTSEAARAVGVGRSTLWRWIQRGLITPHARTAGGHIRWDVDRLRDEVRALRPDEQEDPMPATAPERQPIVAAIVTSHLGVLATRRNDGKPPWGFVTGEIEPGEAQIDAAVREVKEETGLEVRAGHHEIGRRVHPKTHRTMIYLACTPVRGTDVFVGDTEELAEVRWISLAEVDTLLPGVFEPVREHLGRLIS
ncbi:MAG: NUDIX domain-containing protein [Pseudonocardia sp.]|nr:NUDIX domain-containing protein [Pseudonocardia sp.]